MGTILVRRMVVGMLIPFTVVAALADDAGAQRAVTLTLDNVPLAEAAARIGAAGGFDITVDRAAGEARVSLQLAEVPPQAALQLLAEVTGLEVVARDRAGAFLLRRGNGVTPPGRLDTDAGSLFPLHRDKVRKLKMVCRHASASAIAGYFGRPALKEGADGLALRKPDAVAPTLYHAWLPSPGDAAALTSHRADLQDEVVKALNRRWTGDAERARACSPFVRMPDGVAAMIGYDPTATLIMVGEPAAVTALYGLVEHLDAPVADVELGTRFLSVSPEELAQLGLEWIAQPTHTGVATLQYALVDPARLPAGSAGPSLALGQAKAAVVGLTRVLEPKDPASGCHGVSPEMLRKVTAFAATCDLKVRAWPAADGPTVVLLDPVFGHVTMRLANGDGGGLAGVDTAVPCLCSHVVVPAGKALVLRETVPAGDFRAPDACPFLARLPLVGAAYQRDAAPAGGSVVLLALTPH
ncbi:MAG: hypothetical protein HYU66_18415 [Armatimonadetes bacterium]|nr:hypothetical protein [Armatimonadota bacterium]